MDQPASPGSPPGLTAEQQVSMIAQVVDTWTDNSNDDGGDKFLSSAHLAMEAIDGILAGNPAQARRDGFIREKE